MIATQIKVLREQREWTQSVLAKKAEMLQPRLSVMESADYSSWSVNTLRRLAHAFDLALSVKFETFSDVILDFEEMSKETLSRPSFKDDPMFRSAKVTTNPAFRRRRNADAESRTAEGLQMRIRFLGELMELPVPSSRDNSGFSPVQKREESNATCIGLAG
jgi:transcriptional regulator with XRE-family HTH domain